MALPPAFLDELRARTPLPALIGRRTKLLRAGRQWKGCCPFHGEKTPSFYVYDDHYHCFGCGAHGDAVGFVMQAEGAGFMEAVARLAAEAGLEVPQPTPAATEAERRRLDLHAVLAAAAAAFQRRLFLPEGSAALAYLRERGLSDETIRRFGLGWAGEARDGLRADLAREGIDAERLAAAGLLRAADDGSPAGELFFRRVMFPIRDRRGQVVSFGGRLLRDGQPKYLNGPETAVFAKRRTLYGLDFARAGAQRGAAVVLVEGYMDVIALHQAGFAGAVAPLGTALTQEQLEALWQLSPAPILCFDGDAAGARATVRAAELALPLLAPDRSLRVVRLPAGEDPDTLLRGPAGAAAVQALLETAAPLADALYDRLREGLETKTPEQRAGFRARLEAAAGTIADRRLAAEYRRVLVDRFYAEFRRRGGGRVIPPPARPAPDPGQSEAERARNLTAILLRHPDLLRDVEEAYAELSLSPDLARVREAILHAAERVDSLDAASLMDQLQRAGLAEEVARVLAAAPYPLPACAGAEAMPAEAEAGWWHIFGLMHRERLEEEVAAARHAFAAHPDATAQRRLIALCSAREALYRGEQEAGEQHAGA